MSFRAMSAGPALGAVAMGGVAGALCRSALLGRLAGGWLAPGLLVANLAGSFVLGFVVAAMRAASRPDNVAWLGGTAGFCGSLTSFSGLAVAVAALADEGSVARGLVVLAANVIPGLLFISLGFKAHSRDRTPRDQGTG